VLPRTATPLVIAIALSAVAYFLIGPAMGGFASRVAMVAGINIILAVSLTVVNGFTGQFSMGHAGCMAVGGYVAAGITYYGSIRLFGSADFAGGLFSWAGEGAFAGPWIGKGDVLFIASCLVGGVAAAGAGYVVGLPSLRLRGDYLAIVTLGFGEIVRVLIQGTHDQIPFWKAADVAAVPVYRLPLLMGGPKGFAFVPNYTTLFWVYFFAIVTLVVCYRLKTSSSGRAFLSIREDEVAAQAMGVDVTRYKVRAFVLSSFFAGLAGGLYAMDIGAINAGDLGFLKSFDIIIMVVLGGMGSISGAALAAILLSILPELLRSPPPIWPLGLAVLIVMAIVQARRRRWRYVSLGAVGAATVVLEGGRRWAVAHEVNIAEYRLILYALLLIVMMILRPQGLFGVREIWDFWKRPRGAPATDAPR
jgi:branched-chain amino acid transport system permease protein